MVVAQGADDFEPACIVVLELNEATGNGAPSAWRRDIGISAGIGRSNVVVEGVDTIGDRIAPITDVEARRVIDVDADRIEHIATLVAYAAGDVVAGSAGTAIGGAAAGIVIGLGLIVVDAIGV